MSAWGLRGIGVIFVEAAPCGRPGGLGMGAIVFGCVFTYS